jgi:hypothetical protein
MRRIESSSSSGATAPSWTASGVIPDASAIAAGTKHSDTRSKEKVVATAASSVVPAGGVNNSRRVDRSSAASMTVPAPERLRAVEEVSPRDAPSIIQSARAE